MFFLPCIAIIIAALTKKNCSYRNSCGIRLHDVDLEHSLMKKIDVHMFFFPFFCSGIPDLALGIVKILTRVCFRDVIQAAKSILICSWHDIALSQFVQ